jgi:hypothetical protein
MVKGGIAGAVQVKNMPPDNKQNSRPVLLMLPDTVNHPNPNRKTNESTL